MLVSVEGIEPDIDGHGLRIGVVQSRFNGALVDELARVCIEELLRLGVASEDILLATVPGALEIPLALQKMAVSDQFDAMIAVGAVIRGETYHFELVANESGAGVSRVALDTGLPVANGILTTDTEEQARARLTEKGRDVARVAVEMANLVAVLEELRADEAIEDEGGLG